jgi:hypothetical protein
LRFTRVKGSRRGFAGSGDGARTGVVSGADPCGFSGGKGGGVSSGGDLDSDSPACASAAAGLSGAFCRPEGGQGSGDSRKMPKKVNRIKLGQHINRRLMKRVLERDGWRCQKCGSLENLQVHHQIKRSQQGNDALGNLVTLCAYCHMGEHGQLFYSVPAARVCSKPKHRRK